MSSGHLTIDELSPFSPNGENDFEDVLLYLEGRGLGADDPENAELFRRLFEVPFRCYRRRISVSEAARLMYISRRTLGRRCQKAGFPHPTKILRFARILNTVRVIRMTGWTIGRAATSTGWPDSFTFSNSIYQAVGIRPTDARSTGILAIVEAWLGRELERGGLELREPVARRTCPRCGGTVPTAMQLNNTPTSL